ncbi:MAG: hypothetical protein H6Q17_718 [Bacteroidetes bacterium]|nr:hypothetical protein [Bacteroidota bacterium]
MDQTLYFFNPEHDLALANNDRNFNAPQQAKRLAHDLACLPLWYAPTSSVVWTPSPEDQWFGAIRTLFPQIAESSLSTTPDFSQITSLISWGWDTAAYKRLTLSGADPDLLPSELQLSTIRQLSHRNMAIKALDFIRTHQFTNAPLPQSAQELTSIDAVENYAAKYARVIFKAPWSGSGKGLCWVRDKMTDSHRGWCRNIINKQGSILAERIYDNKLDFAMEFKCSNGITAFAGYSLFKTEKGIYRSNFLLSDRGIVQKINDAGIETTLLRFIQNCLHEFIASEIAPHYAGMLGVDMFVYEEDGQRKFHPCVEINLRMTMGCVARIFFDRFVNSSATGHFYIDHYPTAGELWQDHLQRQSDHPLHVADGRIAKGYLALSDIQPHSHYRARIEIDNFSFV